MGASGNSEIPLLSSFLYLFDEAEAGFTAHLLVSRSSSEGPIRVEDSVRWGVWLGRAHLSNDNAGVLRRAQ